MGLFYAWVRITYNGGFYQRLAIFVNCEAADEWWRRISTPPSPYVGRLTRLSPQFYVQSNGEDIYHSFNNSKSSDKGHFFQGMIFACISDGTERSLLATPPTETTDHISGRWYFICSKAGPSSYWYLRTSGACVICGDVNCDAIHISTEHRTRFCIRIRNNGQVPEDFVMIGKDEVSITAPKGYILFVNDEGDLKAEKGYQDKTDILFGDLKNRFVTRAERQVHGEVWEYIETVERGAGEHWQLVD